MFRKIAALILLIILLSFNACGDGGVFSDDSQKADARLEQVIEAIENHDKEALSAMFSQQALNEAEDFDGRMDYLFKFVQGDIKSWEREAGGVDLSKSSGNIEKKSRYRYTVKTDKEVYLFFLLEYPEDTDHPENIGLFMLQVIKAEDEDTQFDGGQDILCAGIYRTEEDGTKKIDNSSVYISQSIMNSEIAGYIGKTEAEIEAKYGSIENEGDWYKGLLYTKHENFSGSLGYGNADRGTVTESIKSDSICNTIAFKLSEIMPISNINFNIDELEFIYDEGEGDYYYIFKDVDVPIHITCDENGNIEQDPWIFIYLRTS